MSITEIYNPKFDDFHGEPVVTWRESKGPVRVSTNLLAQYNAWRVNRVPKNEPFQMFWESHGPAIARALTFCGAKALIGWAVSESSVTYRWFGTARNTGPDCSWFGVCPVIATGGGDHDTLVRVTLPTEEDILFTFNPKTMASWLKPKEVTP